MKAVLTLICTLLLPDFPSASAIEYQDGRLYLIGDDATSILVLDTAYQPVKQISIAASAEKRIPKAVKADYEASALIPWYGYTYLMASGSLATEKRRQLLLVPLPAADSHEILPYPAAFIAQLQQSAIKELNIEGATLIGDHLLLSNRGNNTWPENHFILTKPGFWEKDFPLSVVPVTLVTPTPVFAGISELCYVAGKDLLLCTFSSEATANAYDDGAIGDSYIGWISNISRKLSQNTLAVDGLLNLTATDPAFKGEKIEGICVESIQDNQLTLHLVSDNDAGSSRLFKVNLIFKAE
ncbi:DUF6929 family protein [Chitinophaga arvensicola]|uniref:Uncharacterized protein n=1 Tax=Chitinophaga arvensicola TaxID=29529 RepID=A0A1I0S6R6_9BACT|nr:hypothetical protein [Chitinophaga arvensicola]SEW51101.1 hypothetical protein SAMN04488122_4130 [Chitinophaga arvensicola]